MAGMWVVEQFSGLVAAAPRERAKLCVKPVSVSPFSLHSFWREPPIYLLHKCRVAESLGLHNTAKRGSRGPDSSKHKHFHVLVITIPRDVNIVIALPRCHFFQSCMNELRKGHSKLSMTGVKQWDRWSEHRFTCPVHQAPARQTFPPGVHTLCGGSMSSPCTKSHGVCPIWPICMLVVHPRPGFVDQGVTGPTAHIARTSWSSAHTTIIMLQCWRSLARQQRWRAWGYTHCP